MGDYAAGGVHGLPHLPRPSHQQASQGILPGTHQRGCKFVFQPLARNATAGKTKNYINGADDSVEFCVLCVVCLLARRFGCRWIFVLKFDHLTIHCNVISSLITHLIPTT